MLMINGLVIFEKLPSDEFLRDPVNDKSPLANIMA